MKGNFIMGHFASNYKHGKTFNVNSDDFEFFDLKKYIEMKGHTTITVNGVFHYQAKYGERPVLIGDNYKINLPDHCMKDVSDILADDEAIRLINEGHCGFVTSEYQDKNGNTRYSGSFIDI